MLPSVLSTLLRPAAGGIYTVSTGTAAKSAAQRVIYSATSDGEVLERWQRALLEISKAEVALLGVPSDVGAGFVRGANQAPAAIRQALLKLRPDLYRPADPVGSRVVDLGDILTVPQLLVDEMLSQDQLERTRRALYGDPESPLPVSPLSATEAVVRLVRSLNPGIRFLVFGGDHSVSWPVVLALLEGHNQPSDVGILHFDAHTDLLQERLGIRICFATWAYHANQLLCADGIRGRLVQVGIRASGKTRDHWEETQGVRQYWMSELRQRPLLEIAGEIRSHLQCRGVRRLYISNDIDGTDPSYARATGTPEEGGLTPDEVLTLTREVAAGFVPLSADLVEVAPSVAGGANEPEATLLVAARYAASLLEILLQPTKACARD